MTTKKPKGPYTKFGPWFKAQFGRKAEPPSIDRHNRLHEKANAASAVAARFRNELNKADRAQRIYDAALKGWVAGFEAGKLAAKKEKMK